ncbi:hypothetical protein, partial [Clostridium sp.]|uniref:hypothetical protein n=1 Tax=Clostridium sp. TaxID=1506 RepID=UPI002912E740
FNFDANLLPTTNCATSPAPYPKQYAIPSSSYAFVDNQVNFGSVEDCFLSTHKKSVKSNFCKITTRKYQTNPFVFLVANFAISCPFPFR